MDNNGNNSENNGKFEQNAHDDKQKSADPKRNFVDKEAVYAAYQRSLHYLSFRERSCFEVKNYLLDKDFSPDVVEETLQLLAQSKYINDERFAQSLARVYAKREGKKGIKSRLIRAGIADSIIKRALNFDETDGALGVAQKYLRSHNFDREKLWRYLYSKGFESSAISKTVDLLQGQVQDDDD